MVSNRIFGIARDIPADCVGEVVTLTDSYNYSTTGKVVMSIVAPRGKVILFGDNIERQVGAIKAFMEEQRNG